MRRLFHNLKIYNLLKISVRYKNPRHHWSVLKKKKTSSGRALEHFDDFYKSVYGESWKNIRSALLVKQPKYIAIVNNYSDTERICNELESIGAMDLKKIYDASKQNLEMQMKLLEHKNISEEVQKCNRNLNRIVAEIQDEKSIYSNSYEDPLNIEEKVETKTDLHSFSPMKLQSIESNIETVNENSRLIKSKAGLSASQLYEYVPATKLKGMDDFILESEHYGYYKEGADFSINVKKEYDLNIPKNLLLYTFEENNFTKFPKPKTGSTNVTDYFVLDGSSILPVVSLNLQPGDVLLDMCAAPGGKTLVALQSLCPRFVVANDLQESRVNRIYKFFNEFLPDIEDWKQKLLITEMDARRINDHNFYNKILVDVPCTTDRHVLHEDDNNMFKGSRIKERLRLPELQSAILTNALKLVALGGTVVYSTCSLSPIQNDGVVHMALKRAFEESNVVFNVKDQTPSLQPLKYLYNFGDFGLKFGHIVVPLKSKNWGPMYFCKMVRIQ